MLNSYQQVFQMQQTAVKYGIITGAAIVLYLFLFHQINRELVLNPLVYWSTLLIPILGMVMAVRRVRSDNGGEIGKQEALKTAFLVFVLAQLFFGAFIYILFNFLDTGLTSLQLEMMKSAGRDTENVDLRMTPGRVLFQTAYMLIPGFFLSYMVAGFMRK